MLDITQPKKNIITEQSNSKNKLIKKESDEYQKPSNSDINLKKFIELAETKFETRTEAEKESIADFLRGTELLQMLIRDKISELDVAKLLEATLSQHLEIKNLPKKKILFRYNDLGDKFYIILSGKVSLLIPKTKRISLTGGAFYDYLISLYLSEEDYLLKTSISSNCEEVSFSSYENFLKYEEIHFKNLLINLATANDPENLFNSQNLRRMLRQYKRDAVYLDFSCESDLETVFKLDKIFCELKENVKKAVVDRKAAFKAVAETEKSVVQSFYVNNIKANNFEQFDFKDVEEIEKIVFNFTQNFNNELNSAALGYKEHKAQSNNNNCNINKNHNTEAVNSHCYSDEEKDNQVAADDKKENLFETYKFVFKHGSLKSYITDFLQLTADEKFFYDKYQYLREYTSSASTEKQYKIICYEKLKELSAGEFFGDFALESESRMRTATIVSEEDCILGYIQQAIYDQFIFKENKKIRTKISKRT